MRALSDEISENRYAKWHIFMMLLILVYGLFNLAVGEKVPTAGGFGWDGVTYADIVRNLPSLISSGHMTGYYAQRLLPSAIVRVGLLIFGFDFSNTNLIRGFGIYNLAMLLAAAAVWKAISDHLRLRLDARWLGFVGIFVNFLATKQVVYMPLSTDTTAVLVGMLLLLCYLKQRPVALLLVTIAGSFAWQVTGLCGALLMLFLRTRFPDIDASEGEPRIVGRSMSKLLVAWSSFLVVCIAGYVAMRNLLTPEALGSEGVQNLGRFVTGLPSLIVAGAAIFVLLGSVRQLRRISKALVRVDVTLLVFALLCIAIPKLIVAVIANRNLANPNSFSQVLEWVVFPLNGEGKFLMPLVTLSVFWGPAFLLMILLWSKIAAELRRLGPGVMAVVCLHVPLALVTEPRYILGAWPFAVTALALTLEKTRPSRSFGYAFATLSVLASQFWLHINYRPWTGGDVEGLLEFPKQLLFMHYGPWMSWTTFLIQLPLVLLSAFWLRSTLRSAR
ncbi:hypothetical protein FAZ69_05125 [Trinickia terrae]|uniref:Uncharacterized protein n=1 Tax=Trinickia terrae TaxID=2571161 RepID=A0A4U1IDT4_9BURK|nr:hypothetical protein [Trinickia terrae]TKC91818.1 hypothetical protein FAZ69_05125 [Trinickia terrae]